MLTYDTHTVRTPQRRRVSQRALAFRPPSSLLAPPGSFAPTRGTGPRARPRRLTFPACRPFPSVSPGTRPQTPPRSVWYSHLRPCLPCCLLTGPTRMSDWHLKLKCKRLKLTLSP